MDRMLYIAMTGAKQVMEAQRVNTHNLANANTTGFKADLAAFTQVPVEGPGYQSRVYGMVTTPGTDLRSGTLVTTGRDLDAGISGDGWFAVQAPDGSEAYSRDGNLRVATGGLLTNGAGHPMLGENGPVVIAPASQISIGTDGSISIIALGQAANTVAVLDRLRMVKPDNSQMVKGQDGLMRMRDGSKPVADATVSMTSGALESSNVNPIDALVTMIGLSRQYELQIKSMDTAKENDQHSTQMMRLG